MLDLYSQEDITEEDLCHINFGLGKAYQDLGDFKLSFKHFNEGNILRKKLLNYNITQDIEHFSKIFIFPNSDVF